MSAGARRCEPWPSLKLDRSRRDRSRAPRVRPPGSTVCRGAWHWRPDAQIIPDVLRRYLILELAGERAMAAFAPGEQKRFEPLVVAPARRHDIGSQVVERANIRDFLRRGRSQPVTSQGIGIEKRTVRDHLCLHSHHLCVLAQLSAPLCNASHRNEGRAARLIRGPWLERLKVGDLGTLPTSASFNGSSRSRRS